MNKTIINTPSEDFFSSAFLLGNIGTPFIIGFAVGYFAKKMLRTLLFLAGAAIVALFISEYYGIVQNLDVELQRVAQSATNAVKWSGDYLVHRLSDITSKGVSSTAGFFVGFKLG